ncbi:MAG: phosphoribosylanthranilate isomerase [Chthoniobacterales bacterium]|nr:phosphoribosylanthranilate isomerase [Chthoniobacterales bacterium]
MSAAPQVKICGITNLADAQAAIAAGADALGFNFFPGSKRYLDRAVAAGWLQEVPATVRRVAVVVNPTMEQALAIAALPFIDGLQLHGSETPAFCAGLAAAGIRFSKALAVRDSGAVEEPAGFATRTIVLDAQNVSGFGGTGRSFRWPIARALIARHRSLRFVLAGGLSPENVTEAIALVRPYGVDVTTGVELSAGRKDAGKLRRFVAAAKAA